VIVVIILCGMERLVRKMVRALLYSTSECNHDKMVKCSLQLLLKVMGHERLHTRRRNVYLSSTLQVPCSKR